MGHGLAGEEPEHGGGHERHDGEPREDLPVVALDHREEDEAHGEAVGGDGHADSDDEPRLHDAQRRGFERRMRREPAHEHRRRDARHRALGVSLEDDRQRRADDGEDCRHHPPMHQRLGEQVQDR